MGKEDVYTSDYLENAEVFADLVNGVLYHGEQVVKLGELRFNICLKGLDMKGVCMCNALMELMKDELDERERIRERRGEIKSLVETCMEFGVSHADIFDRLIRKFKLTKEAAVEVYGKYAG